MSPVKYVFDEGSGQFLPVKAGFLLLLGKTMLLIMASLGFAVLFAWQFYRLVEPPDQKRIRIENEYLKENFEALSALLEQQEKILSSLEERDVNLYRVVFESEPDYLNFETNPELKLLLNSSSPEFTKNLARKYSYVLDTLKSYMKQEVAPIDVSDSLEFIPLLATLPSIQPVRDRPISSGFGFRIHPIYKLKKFNQGVDYQSPAGTPVYATADGIVSFSGNRGGHGTLVTIEHNNQITTWYAHLKVAYAKKGKKVKRGEVIGEVGNTGVSISPHLHYEVHVNGKPTNPVSYFFADLSPHEHLALAKKAATVNQSF